MKITGSFIPLFALCVLSAADIVRERQNTAVIRAPEEFPHAADLAEAFYSQEDVQSAWKRLGKAEFALSVPIPGQINRTLKYAELFVGRNRFPGAPGAFQSLTVTWHFMPDAEGGDLLQKRTRPYSVISDDSVFSPRCFIGSACSGDGSQECSVRGVFRQLTCGIDRRMRAGLRRHPPARSRDGAGFRNMVLTGRIGTTEGVAS